MLGVMWRDGLVPGRKDPVKAELGEYKFAVTAFDIAVRYGSPFEAHFYLGKLFAHSFYEYGAAGHIDVARETCESARAVFKNVAERGTFLNADVLNPGEVYGIGSSRDILGEAEELWRGSEIGQNNLAYVLDQDISLLRHARPATSPILGGSPNESARIALTQWTRSAGQRNIDTLVKVRFKKAVVYYHDAADEASALAMWNLGWMYENGVGDFHLAKQHYDQAIATNSEAYLPAMLSNAKLYARSLWLTIRGGGESMNLFLAEEKLNEAAHDEHEKAEVADRAQREQQQHQAQELLEDEDTGSWWHMGKARDDFHKRRR
ncbi:hypothetical protein CONPUDRAFT_154741 [Coniophora puteana RWD-64-598 SS2]|uniref:HCP-like protein n=1 Tax=Coniophora puteana (strain RWD-64-598) TaxID=741705 RepID=A0A5M3MNZ0_CONPW|nr:uncharacterized protein CONPUDRAFT_154741 [Coniophora puteana RWD-64-598 SS2]EIW80736.1 hypothetical protein CONPUDRAFT_154741 [Coniophora puteana RWD-64-598 SS2]